MKKNLFFGLCAASMLLMTSCEKDSFANLWGEKESEVANVTLSVSLPELQTATRAYGEGKNATNLQYAVYSLDANDAINELIEKKNVVMDAAAGATPTKDLVIKLIPGTRYSIVLWADAYGTGTGANFPFTVEMEKTANKVTVDAGKIKTSDDNADAFFGSFVINVVSASSFSITDYLTDIELPEPNLKLKRPFAQLNIASTLSDFNILKNSGFDLTQTTVTVNNAFTSMDLRTGEVPDETNATSVSFALNDLPTDQSVNTTTTHKLLSVNYILMSADKFTATEVVFTYSDGTTPPKRKSYANVPLQRNWRTNIYGDLFTDPVNITVSIAPSFANQTGEDEDNSGKDNDECYNGENGKFPNNSTPNP